MDLLRVGKERQRRFSGHLRVSCSTANERQVRATTKRPPYSACRAASRCGFAHTVRKRVDVECRGEPAEAAIRVEEAVIAKVIVHVGDQN